MRKIYILAITLIAFAAIPVIVFASGHKAEAELKPPTGPPSGIEAEIKFTDDGSTLTIDGKAEGLDPDALYGSLIYDVKSKKSGARSCEPEIFDPEDPNNILNTMFVGIWAVGADGKGTLAATNLPDDIFGINVGCEEGCYVPLSKIGTISVRLFEEPDFPVQVCGAVKSD